VGNSLAAAVLRLEVAARELERGRQREAPGDLLREEAQALRSAMSSVRDWTFWTRPWPALETGATGVAPRGGDLLVAEIDRLSRRISLPIQVTGAALLDDPIVSLPLRLVVLRIAQEALTNVAKHAAGATRAQVQLDREAYDLILTICDDGPGLCGAVLPADTHPNAASDSADHSAAPAPGAGIGMASMRERARGAGGSLTIETAPRGGVIVCARLPLPLNRKDR
jgi:signal transduction histidine kinase